MNPILKPLLGQRDIRSESHKTAVAVQANAELKLVASRFRRTGAQLPTEQTALMEQFEAECRQEILEKVYAPVRPHAAQAFLFCVDLHKKRRRLSRRALAELHEILQPLIEAGKPEPEKPIA